MKYSHLVHHGPNDSPAICARCGAPIAWEHVLLDENGELIGYGSTCVKVVLGQNFDEEQAQREYQRSQQRRERIRCKLAPTAEEKRRDAIGNLMVAYFDAKLAGDEEQMQEIMTKLNKQGWSKLSPIASATAEGAEAEEER